jgi:hypothetical protein
VVRLFNTRVTSHRLPVYPGQLFKVALVAVHTAQTDILKLTGTSLILMREALVREITHTTGVDLLEEGRRHTEIEGMGVSRSRAILRLRAGQTFHHQLPNCHEHISD